MAVNFSFDPYYEINDDKKYDQLVSLLKKLSIGTADEKYTNVNSKEFLSQFKRPVRYLLDKKTNDPSYFDQFDNEELLEFLLKETFIRSNTMPSKSDLKDMDAVFFSSGQLITLCENFITFDNIKDEITTDDIWVTQMMAKFPTEEQKKICTNLLKQKDLFNESNSFDQEFNKYAKFIWETCFGSIDVRHRIKYMECGAKYIECVNIIETCQLIQKLISKYLPDSPSKILIITVQPQQTALALENYFKNKNYPHKFYFAKNTTKDIEESKSLYFNESRGVTAGFSLRDLAEEIED